MRSALLAPLLTFVAVATGLAAQAVGIRIDRAPERLSLPAAPGSNLLLEVVVAGEPRGVWLSTSADREARVELAHAGPDRWQVNLGDPQVAALIRADTGDVLFVYAATAAGVQASAPITFARAPLPTRAFRCRLHSNVEPAPIEVTAERPQWIAPRQIERIEVTGNQPQTVVVAQMASTDCPLVKDRTGERWTLLLDDGKRAAWLAAGSLAIVVQRGDETAVCCALPAIPAELDLASGIARFAVAQRRTAAVPGSRGYLSVTIDDITGGQVLLGISSADGRDVVPQRSVRSREPVTFELAGGRYVLVPRLVNLLIGNDYAQFEVMAEPRFASDRIERLLARIAAAPVVFVRNGQDHTGADAAWHLRQKLAALGKPPSVDEFVEQIASRSSTTGEAYSVRLPDGTTLPMASWLQQQLQALDAPPPAGQPAAQPARK